MHQYFNFFGKELAIWRTSLKWILLLNKAYVIKWLSNSDISIWDTERWVGAIDDILHCLYQQPTQRSVSPILSSKFDIIMFNFQSSQHIHKRNLWFQPKQLQFLSFYVPRLWLEYWFQSTTSWVLNITAHQ